MEVVATWESGGGVGEPNGGAANPWQVPMCMWALPGALHYIALHLGGFLSPVSSRLTFIQEVQHLGFVCRVKGADLSRSLEGQVLLPEGRAWIAICHKQSGGR